VGSCKSLFNKLQVEAAARLSVAALLIFDANKEKALRFRAWVELPT
jgi:hypothetical protein